MAADPTPTYNQRLTFLRNLVGKEPTHNFSPVAQWLAGRMVSISETEIKMEFLIRDDMCNPMQVLHGGIAATILDDVVGTLVFALGRENAYVSVNLNCDFLNPAQMGDLVMATARVIRAGKSIIHVEAQITDANDRIIAKCTSNLTQTSIKLPG
jgi:acyl-coenzyme A thioesterase 13